MNKKSTIPRFKLTYWIEKDIKGIWEAPIYEIYKGVTVTGNIIFKVNKNDIKHFCGIPDFISLELCPNQPVPKFEIEASNELFHKFIDRIILCNNNCYKNTLFFYKSKDVEFTCISGEFKSMKLIEKPEVESNIEVNEELRDFEYEFYSAQERIKTLEKKLSEINNIINGGKNNEP